MCTVLASRLNLGFNCSCEMPTYIACTMSQWGQKLSPGRARTRNTHVMREVSQDKINLCKFEVIIQAKYTSSKKKNPGKILIKPITKCHIKIQCQILNFYVIKLNKSSVVMCHPRCYHIGKLKLATSHLFGPIRLR